MITNIGNCFYCKGPVFAAPGQKIKWLKRTPTHFGESVGEAKTYPTHKKCRKLSTRAA
jgi:hypothetical protein